MEEALKTKFWKTAGSFSTYEEADRLRKELLGKHTLVKVKMGAPASKQNVFRVKCWDPPPIKKEVKKERKQLKKGKNNKRQLKNENRKIRAGRDKSEDFYRK
tara:strand:+ start:22 stop:327 length:306 start_codon:yes stop_codon:yes gene_type:complete